MARQAKTIPSGARQLAVMANVLARNPVRDGAVIRSKRPPKGAPALTVEQLRDLLAGLRSSDYCREYDLARSVHHPDSHRPAARGTAGVVL